MLARSKGGLLTSLALLVASAAVAAASSARLGQSGILHMEADTHRGRRVVDGH